MNRKYFLRAPLAGVAHFAIVLSIIGAKGAELSTINSGVKPGTAPLARIETSDSRPAGGRYDGDTDRVLVLSDDGPARNQIRRPFPRALLNGESQPKPMHLRAGVPYHFRLINNRTDYAAMVSIFDEKETVEWRLIAKNGSDLPTSQATPRVATLTFAVGEIYDVEFTPTAPGILTLQFGAPKQGKIPAQATDVQVVVR